HVAATISVFGAMLFRTAIAPPGSAGDAMRLAAGRVASLVRWSLATAWISAVVWLLLQAQDVSGEDESVFATIPIVLLGLRFGALLIVRLALLTLAVTLFGRGGQPWRPGTATVLAACALGLQAGLGHGASMADWLGWGLAVTEAVHLLAAGAWLGGLV